MQMEEKHIDMSAQSFFQMKKKKKKRKQILFKASQRNLFPTVTAPWCAKGHTQWISWSVCLSVRQAQQINNDLALKN